MNAGDIYRAVRKIQKKLDAIIVMLEAKVEEDKRRAAQKGKLKGHGQPQHRRDGEGRPPAKAGGGGEPEPGQEGRREDPQETTQEETGDKTE